jgi:acid phosphatase family membrane protein YuiD
LVLLNVEVLAVQALREVLSDLGVLEEQGGLVQGHSDLLLLPDGVLRADPGLGGSLGQVVVSDQVIGQRLKDLLQALREVLSDLGVLEEQGGLVQGHSDVPALPFVVLLDLAC